MSNLDYPISLLEDEAIKFSTALQLSGYNQIQRTNQLDGIRRAINILIKEKTKEEEKKRREKVKEIRKGIVNDKNIKL